MRGKKERKRKGREREREKEEEKGGEEGERGERGKRERKTKTSYDFKKKAVLRVLRFARKNKKKVEREDVHGSIQLL